MTAGEKQRPAPAIEKVWVLLYFAWKGVCTV